MKRLILLVPALCGACELREIVTTEPEDVVVAELVLRAGSPVQTAYLHRTASAVGSARVFDASVVVHEEGDEAAAFTLQAAADSLCLRPAPTQPTPGLGTCYLARGDSTMVRPGTAYRLRIRLSDGRLLQGRTQVPGAFELRVPATSACRLEPGTVVELQWSRSQGAAVYLVATRLQGLREALRARGTTVPGTGPVDLRGLSVTAADTTLLFPSGLGLFDRFDEELHAILVAIRTGLPPDVEADIAIAAADPNYVNWVRGGNFNPSGIVRGASITGGGTGVFGALTARGIRVHTRADGPACG